MFFSKEGETINLVPVFEMNNATQTNRINDPIIRYDFARKVKEYDDPTAKETRKVCAQTVNIGKEQQVFWTTKVWVEVREGGQDKPHWRDVALWCDTGKRDISETDSLTTGAPSDRVQPSGFRLVQVPRFPSCRIPRLLLQQ